MSEDNIIRFPSHLPEIPVVGDVSKIQVDAQRKAGAIKWLREFANHWEADQTGMRVGCALFVEGSDGNGRVTCGGFADDREAQRYFSAWIMNHGLAE